jgi:hypothetical protein
MTVHRLPSGDLLLYSVVALNDDGLKKLEQLGRPAWMIVPHPMHTMDVAFYAERYPELRVIAPDDAKERLASVKVEFGVDAGLEKLELRHHVVPGMKYTEVVLDLDCPGGRALVFTDLLGQGPVKGLFMRLLGPPGGSGVARIVKFRQIRDRSAVRGFLEKVADTTAPNLIATAHSPAIRSDAPGMLRNAASQL